MRTLHTLVLLAVFAFLGGALLALVATARALVWRYRSAPLYANRVELRTLSASVAAAALGALSLVVLPFKTGYSGSGSMSSLGSEMSMSLPSVVEVSRPLIAFSLQVIPLLVAPVLIALAPFAVARSGWRPIVQGLCAMLLGAHAAIGMTGYGTFFAPSGVLMVAAGIFASVRRVA